jgi:hypothetical protein
MRHLGANKSAVILPSEEFDRRMVTGPYPYSILHLAAEAFEDLEGGRPPVMTGTSSAARKLRKMIGRPSVLTIKPPDEPMTFEHSDLTSSPDVLDHVATICTHNAKHR